MYFPYLRGKQFELIAVRELIEKGLIGGNVFPVIEPIKLTSTLKKTIKVAESNNFNLALVFNPEVGTLTQNKAEINNNYSEYLENDFLKVGYIINPDLKTDINSLIEQDNISYNKIVLVHNQTHLSSEYLDTFINEHPLFNLIPDQRRYGRKVSANKVIFTDPFKAQQRNSDYSKNTDEPFSEDHIYYLEEGYVGFSDYCTIGSTYKEGGFRPYAVVIHITYFDDENSIRIKHFVSDTNFDDSDTPRKFYEALEKLINWKNTTDIETYALGILNDHYTNQSYPGLGTLKKLSVMHHIELVDQFLRNSD